MIKIDYKSQRNGLIESKVREIISQLPFWSETLEGAKNVFAHDMARIQKVNHAEPSMFYKMEQYPDKLEVWHLNQFGEKDRLMAIITETK